MLSSQHFLSKGPLSSIWTAAYSLKRLHRDQVTHTDIPSAVDKILIDEWPSVTYRVLAYLLLGIVRIHSKKVEFVLHDCRDIINELNKFVSKKKAVSFRKIVHAQDFSVTLPDRYELDAFVLEFADDVNTAHIAEKEDISVQGTIRNDESVNCSISRCHGCITAQEITITYVSKTSSTTTKLQACSSAQNQPGYSKETGTVSPSPPLVENCMEFKMGTCSSQLSGSLEESIEEFRGIRFSREECLDFERFYQNEKEHLGIFESSNIIQSADTEHSESIRIMQAEKNGHFHFDVENVTYTVETNIYLEMPSDNHDSFGTEDKEANFTVQTSPNLNVPSISHKCSVVEDERNFTEDKEANFTVQTSPNLNAPSISHKCSVVEDERNFTDRSPDPEIASDDYKYLTPAKKITSSDLESPSDSNFLAPVAADKEKLPLKFQATPDLKIPDVKDPSSTEFLAVQTPANKERVRKANKRKCLYDDVTVLSNQALKQSINDTSELVRKRRRVPHTSLAVWRLSCIYGLPQKFMEPLIPCNTTTGIVMDTKDIQREFDKAGRVETVEAPDIPVVAVSARSVTEGTLAIAPATPIRCLTSARAFVSPKAADSDGEGPLLSYQTATRESMCQSFQNATKDFVADTVEEIVLELMDKDIGQSGDSQELDGWSTRTRTIARLLRQVFTRIEGRSLNLSQILGGKLRKDSARVFYEILVLGSGEYVNVSQEGPYKDILLQETSKMEAKLAK